MPPAFTGWPPYTFTPRRLDTESRPAGQAVGRVGGRWRDDELGSKLSSSSTRRLQLHSPTCMQPSTMPPQGQPAPALIASAPSKLHSRGCRKAPPRRLSATPAAHSRRSPHSWQIYAPRTVLGGARALLVRRLHGEGSGRSHALGAGGLQLLAHKAAGRRQAGAGEGGGQHGAGEWAELGAGLLHRRCGRSTDVVYCAQATGGGEWRNAGAPPSCYAVCQLDFWRNANLRTLT